MDRTIGRIGIISDTHGLWRTSVRQAFLGVKEIFHAGDVGDMAVLKELSLIAPVHAVRGNMDRGDVFEQLPATLLKDSYGMTLYIVHDLLDLDINPIASGVDAVIYGHSHVAKIDNRNGVWYINPGCAGPNPKRGPASVGVLNVFDSKIVPEIISL